MDGFTAGVTIRGLRAEVLWAGIRSAATIKAWTIVKRKKVWTLTATLDRADGFVLRQRPLMFVAPRPRGFWSWPVTTIEQAGPETLRAHLGPPEQ